jgi:type II secretory pathway component GspD/PulD (secretin)
MFRGSSALTPAAGAFALALCLGGAAGTATAQDVATGAATISVVAEEADLRAVVREIERKAGVNIYVDNNIEEVVSVRLVNLPWRDVLEVVARDAQVEIEQRGPNLYVLTQPPRVFMEFIDAEIGPVLDLLARQAGKNIVIANDVKGKVSLNLRNVHWFRALNTIVKTAGYVAVQEDNDLIRVVRPETLKTQLTTLIYRLRYIRPPYNYKAVITTRQDEEATGAGAGQLFVGNTDAPSGSLDEFTLLTALKGMMNKDHGETIEYDTGSNAFIVKATDTTHGEVESLLAKIDLVPEQVFVDVKFVSTSNKNFWRSGLKIGDPINTPGDAGFLAGLLISGQTPAGGGVPSDAGTSLGQFPFVFGNAHNFLDSFNIPSILDFSQMQIVAQFVDVDQNSKVTQAPTLLSLNGQPAVIFVGEKVPFAEQKANVDQNGTVTVTLEESSKSPQDVGFTLFITPHIVRDSDEVILSVIPRVTRLTGRGSDVAGLERFQFIDPQTGIGTFIDLPRIFDQTVVTTLLVRDKETAVIGGLLQETVFEVEERIPVLSAIPIIGNLFSFDSKDYAQENQIIFVTPQIVRTVQDSADLFKRQYQVFQQNDFFYQKYLKEGHDGVEDSQGTRAPNQGGASLGAEEGTPTLIIPIEDESAATEPVTIDATVVEPATPAATEPAADPVEPGGAIEEIQPSDSQSSVRPQGSGVSVQIHAHGRLPVGLEPNTGSAHYGQADVDQCGRAV